MSWVVYIPRIGEYLRSPYGPRAGSGQPSSAVSERFTPRVESAYAYTNREEAVGDSDAFSGEVQKRPLWATPKA